MILSGIININGTSSDGKMISITLVAQAPGTYTVDANSPGVAAYNEPSNGVNISYSTNQSNDPTLSGGSVTITEIDQNNKTISGTFSFNGYDVSSGSGVKKVISEGVFDKLPFITTLPPASNADTFKVKIDGVDFSAASIAAPIISGQLLVQGAASDGSNFVGILMPQNVQPGSYTLDFFGGNFIGEYNPDANTALLSQGNGTLTIIENNTTTKRIKGTFSFVASDIANTKTAQLTEGFFSVRY